jgi:hypothetical protein
MAARTRLRKENQITIDQFAIAIGLADSRLNRKFTLRGTYES